MRNINLTYLGVWSVLFSILGFFSLVSGLPSNIITPKNFEEDRTFWVSFFPQGWAFFSKSQRDPMIIPYELSSSNEAESLSLLPSAKFEYFWGLSRDARGQGVEVGNYAYEIPQDAWQECETYAIDNCLRNIQKVQPNGVKVENPRKEPTVCGDTYLLEYEPTPWSYRKLTDEKIKPLRAVHVEVNCLAK